MSTRMVPGRPRIGPEALAALLARWGRSGAFQSLPSDRDLNFRVDAQSGERFVLKLSNAREDPEVLAALGRLASRVGAAGIQTATPVPSLDDALLEWVHDDAGQRVAARLVPWVEGPTLAESAIPVDSTLMDLGATLARMDDALAECSEPALHRPHTWDLLHGAEAVRDRLRHVPEGPYRHRLAGMLRHHQDHVEPLLQLLERQVVHNDPNDHNLILEHAGPGAGIRGILDFGDAVLSLRIADLAVACAYLSLRAAHPVAATSMVASAYHAGRPLTELEWHLLLPLVRLRLMVSVAHSAEAATVEPDNPYLFVSQQDAWNCLDHFDILDLTRGERRLRRSAGLADQVRTEPNVDAAGARARHFGPSLGLSYDAPLTLTRGWMQHVFDAAGRRYLDCVNNVCHVGHSHPRVVEAIYRQAALLNTNTRYLHPLRARYGERLCGTLPAPLEVCFLVSSGSEANELAVRLARAATGRHAMVVLEGGYHGHTSTLIGLSHYKFAGKGGAGAPAGVHVASLPDPYRGRHADATDPARAYSADVARALDEAERDGGAAALLVEAIPSCGGQIVPPEGFLMQAFAHARAVGALTIADEVQTGFGRVGTHRWAFETQGVAPDIVTLGKPMGNGHPIGAVVTTRAIAEAFANGMEFFATFGGNPVSCAAGLAVLDVLEEEELQTHALEVGTGLLAGLQGLAQTDRRIGDVRGLGLFLGVELVKAGSREPDATLAHDLVQFARHQQVLLSADGPDHNVIKIKPPLPFTTADAAHVVETLGRALTEVDPKP